MKRIINGLPSLPQSKGTSVQQSSNKQQSASQWQLGGLPRQVPFVQQRSTYPAARQEPAHRAYQVILHVHGLAPGRQYAELCSYWLTRCIFRYRYYFSFSAGLLVITQHHAIWAVTRVASWIYCTQQTKVTASSIYGVRGVRVCIACSIRNSNIDNINYCSHCFNV